MSLYSVELDSRLAEELTALFHRVGPDGYIIKHFVGLVGGKVRAEVRSNEHPPPHFHITYDGEDASYDLMSGRRLPMIEGLERYDASVHLWWKKNRVEIAEKWNNTRPSNCPVGPFPIPDEWVS